MQRFGGIQGGWGVACDAACLVGKTSRVRFLDTGLQHGASASRGRESTGRRIPRWIDGRRSRAESSDFQNAGIAGFQMGCAWLRALRAKSRVGLGRLGMRPLAWPQGRAMGKRKWRGNDRREGTQPHAGISISAILDYID